jgi:signal transduction histidine kinase
LRGRLVLGFTLGVGLVIVLASALVGNDHSSAGVWIALPVVMIVVATMTWFLVGAALQPVTRLTREAGRLSMADPGTRLLVPDDDNEFSALARELNGLLARVEDALASERSFVDDASHELRTPLTILRGELELAELSLADAHLEEAEKSVASARAEAERLSRLADDLLVLARLDRRELPLRRRAVNVLALAGAVAERLGTTRPKVVVTGDTQLVNADPDRVDQVLTNLIGNARRFATSRVDVQVEYLGPQGVEVVIADDGPGFPPTFVPGAFDRFRRADLTRGRHRDPTSSTGLGLAIAAAIVHAHGGTITAGNGDPPGGAMVRFVLPL